MERDEKKEIMLERLKKCRKDVQEHANDEELGFQKCMQLKQEGYASIRQGNTRLKMMMEESIQNMYKRRHQSLLLRDEYLEQLDRRIRKLEAEMEDEKENEKEGDQTETWNVQIS